MPHCCVAGQNWSQCTQDWLSKNSCNIAFTGSVIFNPECTRKRLFVGRVPSVTAGEAQTLLRFYNWNWGGNLGAGKGHKEERKEWKGWSMKEGKGGSKGEGKWTRFHTFPLPAVCIARNYCYWKGPVWWDSNLISRTNWFPSVLWHC